MEEVCRTVHQRTEFARQALRPHHWRQSVDRWRGGQRPLREAQQLFHEEQDLDGRLHASNRRWLCGMAEEHAELLGASGNGPCRWVDLSEVLLSQTRVPPPLQAT